MERKIEKRKLIVPVYINEKIVIDMLAIIEDGFSEVTQFTSEKHVENDRIKELDGQASTNSIISRFIKVDLKRSSSQGEKTIQGEGTSKEKVHTNVSLLSKFIEYLNSENIIKTNFKIKDIEVGDFIEFDGTLQKNPFVDSLDKFLGIIKMVSPFIEETQPEVKKGKSKKNKKNNEIKDILKQVEPFVEDLKNSGTIDFIMSKSDEKVVLSTQEKYLENDNVSEIIGGHFKILGKVIAVYKKEGESINLLRKTNISILGIDLIEEMFSGFNTEEMSEFNLPKLEVEIPSPAMIVIPIAIYS